MDSKSDQAMPTTDAAPDGSVSELVETKTGPQHLTGAKLYSVLVAVSIAAFLMSMDIAVLATAIPSITTHFHTTADIGWYGAAYPLSVCALQLLSGKLATIFPLRWVFQAFFLTFLLGSLLCGAAPSSKAFIVGRAIAGMGGSGISTGALSIIAIVSPPKQRALLTGILISLLSVAMVVAPVIGGALTQNVSWRWCFYINLPAGAVTIGLLLAFLHPPRTERSEPLSVLQKIKLLDLFGCFLFASAMIMLFLALQWGGGDYAWKSGTIVGLFVGFGVVLILFLAWEKYRGDEAMIPFSLMRMRSLYVCALFFAFVGGSNIVPVYYLPEWFQVVKGVGPTTSGIRMLPLVSVQTFAMVLVGGSSRSMKYYNPFFMVGTAIICVSSGLFTTFTAFSTRPDRWITFQVVQGLGVGTAMQMPMLMTPIVMRNKPTEIPLAISFVMFSQFFGNSIFQATAAAIYKNQLVKNLQHSAGLNGAQIRQLLDAGNTGVRRTVSQGFPDKLHVVLEAYNSAITQPFWLELAGAAGAFCISFGLEWLDTREQTPNTKKNVVEGEGIELAEDLQTKV